jgi:hypothetical protein
MNEAWRGRRRGSRSCEESNMKASRFRVELETQQQQQQANDRFSSLLVSGPAAKQLFPRLLLTSIPSQFPPLT